MITFVFVVITSFIGATFAVVILDFFSRAERSGVPKGCPPLANCSAGARADAPIDSPIGSVVPREKAEPSGTEVLLACPFCGSGAIKSSPPINDPDQQAILLCSWQMVCGYCGCIGGSKSTEALAKLAWNSRAGDPRRNPDGAPPSGERALTRNEKPNHDGP